MVLWEITLATAYVLGLRRTYRLALRGQRRLLGTKYPKIREFTERRTRAVFTMALHMYQEIQRRDITVGRNVGNWLLRWLDRARPQANIRGDSGTTCHPGTGRPSAPPVQNKSTKASETKRLQIGARESAGSKSPVNSGLSNYKSHVRGRIGNTIRSRLTDNFTPKMRSLPALVSGLWWQPVRRHSADLASLPNASNALSLSPIPRLPVVHVLQNRPCQRQRSVFREDIARLMRVPATP
ncbi:hypothetical protein MPTK1_3g20450 [Marchantia polymorpha subsp. ruderalis]|uniref:Uncharacterized protein n=2 Tax=Marchantia polymorpha TaxID=3197 RepID=A0AAF6B2X4_MARPO|nr:hypothetical protein MARPO_0149s0010 [Marchantia polymorpha]BBN06358.1 hypothetical protein Mp_3g20450 [Marchantia polymorpha subsp. ruderalis]|eukprot:PTQ29013.1 hypothetical protein MARPO_0149s0010 [Marchantia polymorpha]